MNSVNLIGRLVRDPDLRYTQSNAPCTSFTLAVDRMKMRDKEKKTDFIDCYAWNDTATFIAKHFRKGQLCGVSGSLQIREWTDKNGNKRRNAEVKVDSITFCDGKPSSTESENTSDGTPAFEIPEFIKEKLNRPSRKEQADYAFDETDNEQ